MKFLNLFFIAIFTLIFSGCFSSDDDSGKFYGNVDVRTVSLAFRVSGRLQSINVDEGQKVKRGEVIAKLDDSIYLEHLNEIDAQISMQKASIEKLEKGYRQEDIKKAQAKLDQSKIEKDRLKKEFNRVRKLYKSHSVSEQKYDDSKAAYEGSVASFEYQKSSLELLENGYEKEDIQVAKAQLRALMAQRKLQQINLEDTVLVSPTNGTVLTRVYEEGSILSPSQNVVELAKEDEYWVRSYMSEKYLGVLKVGQKAKIYTDNNKTYEGKISFISAIAEFTPKTVQTEDLRTDLVYRFRIILDKFDDNIKQGMPVTIRFPNTKLDD